MQKDRIKGKRNKGGGVVLALLLIAGLTLLFNSCDRFGKGDSGGAEASGQAEGGAGEGPGADEQNGEEQTVFAVSTTEAVLGRLKDYIEVNGDVVAKTTVQTFPDSAGKLTELSVDLGDRVWKEQVIAKVDPSKPGMQYEASPVKAPISGTITDLPAQEGSTVNQQMSVAQISKMDELQVRTDVAERFISKMKVGLRAVITTEAYPDRVYEGRVTELSPVVDPQARMMEVKINFIGGSEGLKSGMFVEVKIVTEVKDDLVKLPVDCVVERFGEEYVFVVKEAPASTAGEAESDEDAAQVVERRVVSTGIEIDRKVEILEGVNAGEELVYRGQTLLEDGSPVKVVSTVEPLSSEDVLQ